MLKSKNFPNGLDIFKNCAIIDENKKLSEWKSKLERAKNAYTQELARMEKDQAYYDGTHSVLGNRNSNKAPTKQANNVRNIVYELVESQVDTSIPYPKVTPIHEEDAELAKTIENLLINEIKRMRFHELNDVQERNVPVLGGDFFQVEWDKNAGFHCTVGDLSVSERNPKLIEKSKRILDLAKELSDTYDEILIDEFQDTNEAQNALFDAISKNSENKFMVGDVKQSIYRFRQAMPEIFISLKDAFSEYNAVDYPANISLDRNFRSRN